MGTWDEGIYDDDLACDVRDTIKLLSSMPATSEQILSILMDQYPEANKGSEDYSPTFWIATADQLERKGIICRQTFDTAIEVIENGDDLKDLEERGIEEKGLDSRAKITKKLVSRLQAPRPPRKRLTTKSKPKIPVSQGQVFAFPTMDRKGFNAWFSDWPECGFVPDGWGSLIILKVGRVFDWFPYCAYTPLAASGSLKPTLDEALDSRTCLDTGAAFCLPKSNHLKKMKMELLGTIDLDDREVQYVLNRSDTSPQRAVVCGWSICSGAFGASAENKGYFDVKEIRKN